ncbi:MAG: FGGY-family carbohydrate kinase [bacterium]|nr:FGGY-family carbohydrate kinase [bacterium]
MADEVVVGVDIGTGAARAVTLDRAGRVLANSEAWFAAARLSRGEADPFRWLEGLVLAVVQLDAGPPAALGIGGQGPTTVMPSAGRALTYRHPAGASSDFAGQHLAQAEEMARLFGGGDRPRQMWDFLAAELGGSPDTQAVWPGQDPLEGFGDPIAVGSTVGVTAGDSGLPAGIVLAPAANDAFLTAWAAAIDRPGKGFDPGGRTGGLGVAAAPSDHPSVSEHGIPGHVPGIYLVGGPAASHGAMLDWWSSMTGRTVPDLIEAAAGVAPGSDGVTVLPFLEGERAPRWVPELRAEIHGLGSASDQGVVARALLEASAYGLAHIARDLARHGVTMNRMVSSGAPSRSNLWVSIKASVLGVPVDVPSCPEMAAYGAALAAGSAVGWWPRPGEGEAGDWPTPAFTTFEPETVKAYEEGLDRFIALGDEATRRLRRGI